MPNDSSLKHNTIIRVELREVAKTPRKRKLALPKPDSLGAPTSSDGFPSNPVNNDPSVASSMITGPTANATSTPMGSGHPSPSNDAQTASTSNVTPADTTPPDATPPDATPRINVTNAATAMAKTLATVKPMAASSTYSHFSLDQEARVFANAIVHGGGYAGVERSGDTAMTFKDHSRVSAINENYEEDVEIIRDLSRGSGGGGSAVVDGNGRSGNVISSGHEVKEDNGGGNCDDERLSTQGAIERDGFAPEMKPQFVTDRERENIQAGGSVSMTNPQFVIDRERGTPLTSGLSLAVKAALTGGVTDIKQRIEMKDREAPPPVNSASTPSPNPTSIVASILSSKSLFKPVPDSSRLCEQIPPHQKVAMNQLTQLAFRHQQLPQQQQQKQQQFQPQQ